VNGYRAFRDALEVSRIVRVSYDQAGQTRARRLANLYLNPPGTDTTRLAFRVIMQTEYVGTADGRDAYDRCRALLAYEVPA
jgi:hypothetical protein